MPEIGQIVSVSHNSNGTVAATTTGTVWNKTNAPEEGYKGLYRKEYCNENGKAFERYDENTGVYTQYVNKRTGRNCNGEIFDEAKGAMSFVAGGQVQIKSAKASVGVNGKTGVGIASEKNITLDAGGFFSVEVAESMSESVEGERTLSVDGNDNETYKSKVERIYNGGIKEIVTGEVILNINGVEVKISTTGEVSIKSPAKIDIEAPEVNIKGNTGSVEVNGIKLA